jgi:hypothetical protein
MNMAEVPARNDLGPVVGMVGERFLTGSSLLLQGRLGEGLVHTALGMLAYNFLGLPGVLAVSANSFSRAYTGRNILDHFQEPETTTPATRPAGTKG